MIFSKSLKSAMSVSSKHYSKNDNEKKPTSFFQHLKTLFFIKNDYLSCIYVIFIKIEPTASFKKHVLSRNDKNTIFIKNTIFSVFVIIVKTLKIINFIYWFISDFVKNQWIWQLLIIKSLFLTKSGHFWSKSTFRSCIYVKFIKREPTRS